MQAYLNQRSSECASTDDWVWIPADRELRIVFSVPVTQEAEFARVVLLGRHDHRRPGRVLSVSLQSKRIR